MRTYTLERVCCCRQSRTDRSIGRAAIRGYFDAFRSNSHRGRALSTPAAPIVPVGWRMRGRVAGLYTFTVDDGIRPALTTPDPLQNSILLFPEIAHARRWLICAASPKSDIEPQRSRKRNSAGDFQSR